MSRWDSERAGDPGRVNLRRLFDEIDADGTGRIDMADLQVLAGRLGIRGDADFTVEDKCAVLLDRLDIDADSLVDFDDFCRFVDQYIVDAASLDLEELSKLWFTEFQAETEAVQPQEAPVVVDDALTTDRRRRRNSGDSGDNLSGTRSRGDGSGSSTGGSGSGTGSSSTSSSSSSSSTSAEGSREAGPFSGVIAVLKSLCAGAVSGGVAKTATAPLDRTKILFQVSSSKVFSLMNAGREVGRIVREEGFSSLWRGNGATLARVLPYAGIQLTSFDYYLATLRSIELGQKMDSLFRGLTGTAAAMPMASGGGGGLSQQSAPPTALERLVAGSMAGATSVMFTYPLDLVRTRLAIETVPYHERRYTSTLQAAMRIRQEEGLMALWNGITPTVAGILPYAGIAFLTHGTLKDLMVMGNPKDPITGQRHVLWWQSLASGAVAGLVGQSVAYPLDVVRRRMQADAVMLGAETTAASSSSSSSSSSCGMKSSKVAGVGSGYQGASMLATLRRISAEEGLRRGLFKGLSMNWIKGPIAVGISFSMYDVLKRHFGIEKRSR